MPNTRTDIQYDIANALEIVEGYSKKGEPFGPVLSVKQSERWNSLVIAFARSIGIPTRKVNMPKAEE